LPCVGGSRYILKRMSPSTAWCVYDWANSAFVTTVVAAVLPVYFAEVICGGQPVSWNILGHSISSEAPSLWGYAMALAALLVAVSSPLFGAVADAGGRRKQFLGVFTGIGVLATLLLYTTGAGDVWPALGILVLGQIGFAGANVFYNSLLVSAAPPNKRDMLSSRGFAFGYMGGGLLLAFNLFMIKSPGSFGFPDSGTATRAVFLTVALWWALFSIPLFRFVPEGASGTASSFSHAFSSGLRTLSGTFRNLRRQKNILRFLVAWLLYNDGIQTVIIMAAIFGKVELGIDTGHLIGALLLTQAVGVPGSILFGRMTGKFGAKRMLLAGIAAYIVIILFAFRMQTATEFYVLAGAVGLFQGGIQAVSRSFYASMIPQGMNAEYFGFFSISTRFASIAGPLIFAVIGDLTGNIRLSILALAIIFLAGGRVLMGVREKEAE
jgi:UMF1 family MFS transporter